MSATNFPTDGYLIGTRLDASRDTLLNSINHRRAAIQHAADALWPASDEATTRSARPSESRSIGQ